MDFKKVVDKRKSIRSFSNKKISNKTLTEIITEGTKAPSGMNMQPWYFYVINNNKNLDVVKKITRKYTNSKKNDFYYDLGNCQAIIIVCADKKEISSKHKNNVILSIGACVENMLLSITNRNLGACWIGYFSNIEKELKNSLNISKNKTIVATIIIGYPLSKKQIKTSRKNIKDILKILE